MQRLLDILKGERRSGEGDQRGLEQILSLTKLWSVSSEDREVEFYIKQEGDLDPRETNPFRFANWRLPELGSYPAAEAGRQGPYPQI